MTNEENATGLQSHTEVESEVLFSVFTCTYNRADLLPRVYASLLDQTLQDFEWIVYNNGSTDHTEELVSQWVSEAPFPIRLFGRADNSSIQRAYNVGVQQSRGKFWLMLDSDDACVPESLQRFRDIWTEIPPDLRDNFVGVTVNCIDQHGHFVGQPFPVSPIDSTPQEITWRYKAVGEKWGFQRVEVLRQIPFQDDEHHIQPGAIWRAIGRKYQTRYVNESLRIYFIDEPDREDQLSRHASMDDSNSVGQRINNLDVLNEEMRWFRYSPFEFLKSAVIYSRYSDKLSIGLWQQIQAIDSWPGRLLFFTSLPVKWLYTAHLHFRYRRHMNRKKYQ